MTANVNRARKGFTLAELLVVISVIIILMSMLVVCVNGLFTYFVRLQCQNRMEQLWNACLMYSNKNRILPSAWDFDQGRPWYAMLVASGYLDTAEACYCPSSDMISKYGTGVTTVSGSMPDETRSAIAQCLNWMKANQWTDGSWGHISCDTRSDLWSLSGPTGLGLLAFLGFGCTTANPAEYSDTVDKALAYLINHVDSDGLCFLRSQFPSLTFINYHQGIVVMALSDAYAMMGDITPTGATMSLGTAAQKTLDYLLARQLAPLGSFSECGQWWDNDGGRDISASSWAYQGLASAYRAGIQPSNTTWESALGLADTFFSECILVNKARCPSGHYFVRSLSNCPNCGQPGSQTLTDNYGTTYRFALRNIAIGAYGAESNANPYRMTAANAATRVLVNHAPTEDHSPRTYDTGENAFNQLAWLRSSNQHITYATNNSSSYDLYANYYLTLVFFGAGGDYWDEWLNGNGATFTGFVDTLIQRGVPIGSDQMYYDGNGSKSYCVYANYGGRIYPTSLAAICLDASVGQYIRGSKFNVSTAGEHSYGYNKQIANDENGRRKPAGDTIVMMDYMLSGIDPADDPAECLAPRHGGKVNVLFGDGHTEALAYEDLVEEDLTNPAEPKDRINSHMLSLRPGPDPIESAD